MYPTRIPILCVAMSYFVRCCRVRLICLRLQTRLVRITCEFQNPGFRLPAAAQTARPPAPKLSCVDEEEKNGDKGVPTVEHRGPTAARQTTTLRRGGDGERERQRETGFYSKKVCLLGLGFCPPGPQSGTLQISYAPRAVYPYTTELMSVWDLRQCSVPIVLRFSSLFLDSPTVPGRIHFSAE